MEIDGTDIPDCWALTPADLVLVMAKNEANRVDFALLLLFYRAHGRFPNEPEEIEPGAVTNIAQQLGMNGMFDDGLNKADRTWKRYRAEIRAMFGYREMTVADAEMLSEWLHDQVAVVGGVPEHLAALLNARCRELLIEPPLRGRTLIDDLVDLLIETIHNIGARAERKVDRELLDDVKRVTGKQNLLFEIADATLGKPDGIVREVVFPVVGEETLRDLVKEWKATGPTYRITLRTMIRNSYKGHYRRMVPQVLQALNFHSNNERHQPTIQALDLVKRYGDTKVHTFPVEEAVPLDGVVRGLWREAVIEKDAQIRQRVNRSTYEICVLEALREQLRCKEIWVAGAKPVP